MFGYTNKIYKIWQKTSINFFPHFWRLTEYLQNQEISNVLFFISPFGEIPPVIFFLKKNADSTFPLFKKSTVVSPLVLIPVLVPPCFGPCFGPLLARSSASREDCCVCLFACLRACFAAAPIAVSVVVSVVFVFLLKGSRFGVLGLSCPDLWYIVHQLWHFCLFIKSARRFAVASLGKHGELGWERWSV